MFKDSIVNRFERMLCLITVLYLIRLIMRCISFKRAIDSEKRSCSDCDSNFMDKSEVELIISRFSTFSTRTTYSTGLFQLDLLYCAPFMHLAWCIAISVTAVSLLLYSVSCI